MYILSVTRPLNFSYGFGYGSSMSSSKYCSSRTWMNGNYGIKHITNTVSRSGKLKLPQVCSGNSGLELQPFNEKSKIEESMKCIKEMLRSMGDGVISVSAYDTAWIALINDHRPINIPTPLFPSSLDWIASNQLSDGSWGNDDVFVPCDRLLTTLACVVALRTWNVYPNNSERGILFVKENISKLAVDYHISITQGTGLISLRPKLKTTYPSHCFSSFCNSNFITFHECIYCQIRERVCQLLK